MSSSALRRCRAGGRSLHHYRERLPTIAWARHLLSGATCAVIDVTGCAGLVNLGTLAVCAHSPFKWQPHHLRRWRNIEGVNANYAGGV